MNTTAIAKNVDVLYGTTHRQRFDIWWFDSGEPTPLIIYYHGGGFVSGDKAVATRNPINIDRLALLENRVAFASVNYRYRTETGCGACGTLCDCKQALQFIRLHHDRWNIDGERIGVYGSSGGGGAALWLAFHRNMADPFNVDPMLQQSTEVKVVAARNTQATYDLLRWPDFITQADISNTVIVKFLLDAYGFNKIDDLYSCEGIRVRQDLDYLTQMSASAPPMYIWHDMRKNSDILHSPEHAKTLKSRANEVGLSQYSVKIRKPVASSLPLKSEVANKLCQHL